MVRIPILMIAATCALAAGHASALAEGEDGLQAELGLDYSFCLGPDRPAFSAGHTDCVVARREKRQREMQRLQNGLRAPVGAPLPLLESRGEPVRRREWRGDEYAPPA
jgi:hypothetical protein